MSKTPFFSYYEHLAKLSQVANKQTLFLAHILYHMEFNKEKRQYYVDMSTFRKRQIMAEVSPNIEHKNALVLANQYLNKLQKVGLIRSLGGGVWLIDPMSYGRFRAISKDLRTENSTVFLTAEFSAKEMTGTTLVIRHEDGEEEEISNE